MDEHVAEIAPNLKLFAGVQNERRADRSAFGWLEPILVRTIVKFVKKVETNLDG
jgi:hypothetical protein